MVNRSNTISVRVEPNLKHEAEDILKKLGLSTSTLFTLTLKQVVINKGIPFPIKLERNGPLFLDELTKQELIMELKKGRKDIKEGRYKTLKEVEQSFEEKFKND